MTELQLLSSASLRLQIRARYVQLQCNNPHRSLVRISYELSHTMPDTVGRILRRGFGHPTVRCIKRIGQQEKKFFVSAIHIIQIRHRLRPMSLCAKLAFCAAARLSPIQVTFIIKRPPKSFLPLWPSGLHYEPCLQDDWINFEF